MSLSESQTAKINPISTPRKIAEELWASALHYAGEIGVPSNPYNISILWNSFLFYEKSTLEAHHLLDDVRSQYVYTLSRLYQIDLDKVEAMAELKTSMGSFWGILTDEFTDLHNELEIMTLLEVFEDVIQKNSEDSQSVSLQDQVKHFLRTASLLSIHINGMIYGQENDIVLQFKDPFRTAPASKPHLDNQERSDVNKMHLGMAWYKFLIYFGLIAGAILNIIYGLNYISGGIYFAQTDGKVSAEQVYAHYGPALQVFDVSYGFVLIAFAILAFVLRHKLANYKPDSLKFVKIFYSLLAGVPFYYAILVSLTTDTGEFAVQAGSWAIVGLVILLLNIKYFKKRAHLFVDKAVFVQPPFQANTHPQQVLNRNRASVSAKSTVPEQPTIMFCRKCGTKLFDDSTFCHKCGTKSNPNLH